jgi:hypothetical protein
LLCANLCAAHLSGWSLRRGRSNRLSDLNHWNFDQLITKLYNEIVEYRGEIDNFSSFLRVCCLRYMSLIAEGKISSDKRQPLAVVRPQIALADGAPHYIT